MALGNSFPLFLPKYQKDTFQDLAHFGPISNIRVGAILLIVSLANWLFSYVPLKYHLIRELSMPLQWSIYGRPISPSCHFPSQRLWFQPGPEWFPRLGQVIPIAFLGIPGQREVESPVVLDSLSHTFPEIVKSLDLQLPATAAPPLHSSQLSEIAVGFGDLGLFFWQVSFAHLKDVLYFFWRFFFS